MGLYFNKQYNKYHVRIFRQGKYHHIGKYDSLEEAEKQNNYWKDRSTDEVIAYDNSRESVVRKSSVALSHQTFTDTIHTYEWFKEISDKQIKEISAKYR